MALHHHFPKFYHQITWNCTTLYTVTSIKIEARARRTERVRSNEVCDRKIRSIFAERYPEMELGCKAKRVVGEGSW